MLFPNGWLREMEGDLHRQYRRILVDALQSARWSEHEDAIRHMIRRRLKGIANASASGSADSGVIRAALRAIATDMMLRLLFGVTNEHPLHKPLRRAYRTFGTDAPAARIKNEQIAAFAEIRSIVERIADELRDRPDRLPSCALKRLVETGAANDATALGHLIYTFETSHFDTYSLWRWILKHLSDNPSVTEEMRKRLSQTGPMRRKYAEAIVHESLRTDQSEALMRKVQKDIEFAGHRIPKGSLARICLWEAHKDPDVFEQPFRYDPLRFVEGRYDADEFAPFGLDKHHCVGSALVLFSSALLVEELLAGYEWDVVADGRPHRGRFHWEPSPSFAIRLRPRQPAHDDMPTDDERAKVSSS
jgi:cytochrome P450